MYIIYNIYIFFFISTQREDVNSQLTRANFYKIIYAMYVSMSNNARKRLIFNNMEVAMVISQLFLSCRKCARKNSFRLIPQRKKGFIYCRNKLCLFK